jgi:hypothetical protein
MKTAKAFREEKGYYELDDIPFVEIVDRLMEAYAQDRLKEEWDKPDQTISFEGITGRKG